MSERIINLTCPGCGARVDTEKTTCDYCHQPVIITSFNSVATMSIPQVNKYANSFKKALVLDPDNKTLSLSIAMCYLKLKLYDKALLCFEKAIEDNYDNSEVYFYAAVCLLRGKKAFLAARTDINKIEEYINAANLIEPRGIYYYFWAYVKQDYFERKYLNTSPNYHECLANADNIGTSELDKKFLFDLLGVERPAGF